MWKFAISKLNVSLIKYDFGVNCIYIHMSNICFEYDDGLAIIQKQGSDHLALVSEFAFTQVTKESNTTITTISATATSASREDNDST